MENQITQSTNTSTSITESDTSLVAAASTALIPEHPKDLANPTQQPFVVRPMGEDNELSYWRSVWYGDSGTGKTYLCGTCVDVPEMHDILMVDLNRGRMSISNKRGIDIVSTVSKVDQLAWVVRFLKAHCIAKSVGDTDRLLSLQRRFMGTRFDDRLRIYNTLIIDPLDVVHRLIMAKVLKMELGDDNIDIVPDYIDQRDWGSALIMFRRFIGEVNSLPLNVLYTASDFQKEHKVTKRVTTGLSLPGQCEKFMRSEVDVIGRLTLAYKAPEKQGDPEVPVYRVVLRPSPQAYAKSGIPGFHPAYVDGWTMTDFINELKEARNRNQDAT